MNKTKKKNKFEHRKQKREKIYVLYLIPDNDKQVKIIPSALDDEHRVQCTTKKVINFFALRNIKL